MIFLLMALVVITIALLWNIDLHKIITVKGKAQNAGDSAALAAARWQGITLNMLGDLNILQAVDLSDGDTAAASAIADLQARLCFVGPMIGFVAAQQAAKNNGAFVNGDFTAEVQTHARTVRFVYPTSVGPGGSLLFPEPYPGAWNEYAAMIDMVANDGIAAAPDNAWYYSDPMHSEGYHELYDPEFYDAIATRSWCWFYNGHFPLLSTYTNYTWWPPLPAVILLPTINSEYFSLGLTLTAYADDIALIDAMNLLNTSRGLEPGAVTTNIMTISNTWYCYWGQLWTDWGVLSPTSSYPFPIYGTVKPQYDYAGADACTRIVALADRRTPGATATKVHWTAAAKPFGYLEDSARPNDYFLVLPAYHDIRLFPVDAASGGGAGAFDLEWRRHIERHLPGYTGPDGGLIDGYMNRGPLAPACDPGCFYCQQLATWEPLPFRTIGIEWLRLHSASCSTPSGGSGGGRGGRARRGH